METMVKSEKNELRKNLLGQLLSLTEEEIKRRSKNVSEKLSNLPIYKQAKTIMVYYPIKGEVDILGAIRKDIGNRRFCFPVMDLAKKDILIYEVKDLDNDFCTGPYGIREPDVKRTRQLSVNEIDMIVVPGLAFDRKKNRLGRGGGFYDRFLSKIIMPAKKVGLAFDCQILEDLPIQPPFDQQVDVVVCESETI